MNKATFDKLKDFRRTLHQYPELSGEEKETASRVLEFFKEIQADQVLENLGGHGLAFVFEGKEKDQLRCIVVNLMDYRSGRTTILNIRVRFQAKHICADMMVIWTSLLVWGFI